MNWLIVFAVFAMTSASIVTPVVDASTDRKIQDILAAIQNPSTDPATATALERLLLDVLGVSHQAPTSVEPAIAKPEAIAIRPALCNRLNFFEPAITDFPLREGGAVTAINPTPVISTLVTPSSSTSLVQIVLNMKPSSGVTVESPTSPPGSPVYAPEPVSVVEQPIVPKPAIVVDQSIISEPVIIVDVPRAPVITMEQPKAPKSVIINKPIIPIPAIVIPEILNNIKLI